jgi:hypothetical protein
MCTAITPPPPCRAPRRVPEPGNGWLVRPHVEPHGPDGLDLMEGFYVEKSGVARRGGQDMLQGAPYSHSLSAQCSKEQLLLQVGPAGAGPGALLLGPLLGVGYLCCSTGPQA